MYLSILRFGMLLTLAAGVPAAAQTELFFAAGVDSTGWAQAQSNADGHVLIESPQYPHGLWLHWVDEAGDALVGLQVEYQERPDSLVAIRCVDPVGAMRETLVWTRPEGNALRLTLKPKEEGDLPAGLASIDWQIDPSVESLLDPVEDIRLIGWEAAAAFLKARWQSQAGRVAVQFNARTLETEVDHPEDVETLVAHLQQAQQPADAALGAISPLKMQIFAGNLGLQEGVILRVSWFDDPNLESAVREALGRPQGPSTLTTLSARSKAIISLAGIEYLNNLDTLDLFNNDIFDLTPLNQLNSLEWLDLSGNGSRDLTPLNQLTDLTWLSLHLNGISDLTPLSQLKNLKGLDLESNQIVDLTPLNQLNSLEQLYLGFNQIVDLTPLNQLTNLIWLNLESNQIVDLTSLNQLNELRWLRLDENQITDLSHLVANPGLGNGDEVYLEGNPLSDQALTEQIPALKARGVDVRY